MLGCGCVVAVCWWNINFLTCNMTTDELLKAVDDGCAELLDASEAISKLQPVSHLSKAAIRFSGGIIGGIQDYKEEKRLLKMLNTPFYKEWTFYTFAFHIIKVAEDLATKQVEIQKSLPKENEAYYGNVMKILASVTSAIKAWYEYSPDMANEGLRIGDQKNVALSLTVEACTKDSFRMMDLPDGMKINDTPEDGGNSGCMGSFVALFVIVLMLLSL